MTAEPSLRLLAKDLEVIKVLLKRALWRIFLLLDGERRKQPGCILFGQ